MLISDGTWYEFDYVDAMQSLPEVNYAVSFLTRNNFTAGPNNPQALSLNGIIKIL